MNEMPQNVKQAAKLLDKVTPDWYVDISIAHLDLTSLDYCILGQVYGNYKTGRDILFPQFKYQSHLQSHLPEEWATNCPFLNNEEYTDTRHKEMQWIDEIISRRLADETN